VIPVLVYPSVGEAIDWLRDAFGFSLRLRIGDHRAQLNVGDGAVVVAEQPPLEEPDPRQTVEIRPRRGDLMHSVMVRVDDVDRHHDRASRRGARIIRPPADHPYGERQYTVEDFAGHVWTFSQSIADVAPEDWGGTPGRM
jgi:uncharacterized glyoxalase superfamily protein PhnB